MRDHHAQQRQPQRRGGETREGDVARPVAIGEGAVGGIEEGGRGEGQEGEAHGRGAEVEGSFDELGERGVEGGADGHVDEDAEDGCHEALGCEDRGGGGEVGREPRVGGGLGFGALVWWHCCLLRETV